MGHVEGQVKSKIPSNRLQWIKDIFLGASDHSPSYSGQVLDALCEGLDDKFSELTAYDLKIGGAGAFTAIELPKEETRSKLEKMWKMPLREFWDVGLKIEKRGDGLQLDTETHLESCRPLRSATSETIISAYADVKNLGAFHDMMLRLHKAMHTAAIDFLRPKLRGTMATVYQEELILRALQDKDFKVSFKEQADDMQRRADDIKEHLTTMQAEMKAIGLEPADFKPTDQLKASIKRSFSEAFGG